ncbi:MAG: sulfatase-like hydrolase/transferase [Victivallales bacterium]|nr:sulfatase-like hydrolase/transferase [Victivallales bacterium]
MARNIRTNILLITSDQQHWMTMGFNNPEISTPNLDRLAAQGTIFDRSYAVNPTCTPTRASIITGLYPSQHGAYSLGTKLPEHVHTVCEDFNGDAYRTALVGKAHFQQLLDHPLYRSIESNPLQQDLDFWREFHGPFYGFNHVELARNHTDEFHVGQHYALWMEEKGFKDWRKCFMKPGGTADSQHHTWNIPEQYHYDAWIAERTNALLDGYSGRGENFFLWASFFDPHPSYLVPEPWDKMYDPSRLTLPEGREGEHEKNPPHFQMTQQPNPDFSVYQEKGGNWCHGFHSHLSDKETKAKNMAIYYAMVSLMDKYIGKILDKLDELGLTESTLVVFTTDHGHLYGQHGLVAKGAFHYEDLIRIPHIARLPGCIPAGRRCQCLQSSVDLAPTFLAYAGIEIPWSMTGLNQKDVWEGDRSKARGNVIVENRHQPATVHVKTYVEARYKMTVYCGRAYGELFDLEKDPGEVDNLWDDPGSAGLKARLMESFLQAEMAKESMSMPRVWGA